MSRGDVLLLGGFVLLLELLELLGDGRCGDGGGYKCGQKK
jgi:hypothetical protein